MGLLLKNNIIFFLIFTSCNLKIKQYEVLKGEKSKNENELLVGYNYAKGNYINASSIYDKQYLIKAVEDNYLKPFGKRKDLIEKLEKIYEGPLFTIGKSEVFMLKLSNNIPRTWNKQSLIVISCTSNKMFNLYLNTFEPIKIKKEFNLILSGRRIRDGYGDFASYSLVNDTLFSVFESGIVTNNSRDCINFKNSDLKLKNVDLNNDGLLDLLFEGMEYHFCKGSESKNSDLKFPIDSAIVALEYFCDYKEGIIKYKVIK
jgi:hypothetical protein